MTQIIRHTWWGWGSFWSGFRVCSGLSDKVSGVVLLLASCGAWQWSLMCAIQFLALSWDATGEYCGIKCMYTLKWTWLAPIGTDTWIDILYSSWISLSVTAVVVGHLSLREQTGILKHCFACRGIQQTTWHSNLNYRMTFRWQQIHFTWKRKNAYVVQIHHSLSCVTN